MFKLNDFDKEEEDIVFKNNIFKDILKFITNRLLIVTILFGFMFYTLALKLFDLQIVNGAMYANNLVATRAKELPIVAPRGTIYDKLGRPLAINNSAFSLKIDPSVTVDDTNATLLRLIQLFEKHHQEYVDEFPISLTEPYVFEFNDSESREKWWKENMTVPLDATAEESIAYLRKHFKIDENVNPLEARKLLAIRSSLYLQRFSQYDPITVAYNLGTETMVDLEEHSREFPGIFIDAESLREYPEEKYVSHLIGYIGRISESDYSANKDNGYSSSDLFGRTGLERAFESELRGQNGIKNVEESSTGKIKNVEIVHPIQGNKVFLTIDSELQKKVYHMLEETLKDVLKNKLLGKSAKEASITLPQLFSSMVGGNVISIKKIMESTPFSQSVVVKNYLIEVDPTLKDLTEKSFDKETITKLKSMVEEGLELRKISPVSMLLVMIEQEIITGDMEYIAKLKSGVVKPLTAVIEKMDSYEITPQMTNLDPCTGSVVVTDVNTGSVIAAVNYPSYDNNQLVNNFNNEYYTKIMQDDLTQPLNNRAFMESRAPGSTFKMISALAGLASGAINTKTTIYDRITFEKAGRPYTSCWSIGRSHGSLNVSQALEHSCNYFFCEMAFMMGNQKQGNEDVSIGYLNKYMEDFGLNGRTGVEIGEKADVVRATLVANGWPEDTPIISSPLFKEYAEKSYNPDVPLADYMWRDGDTVRTAIGQAKNDYTSATMAKYVSTLASKGTRYQMHFLDKVTTQEDESVRSFSPVVEKQIDILPEYLSAIYKGMLLVTENPQGTAYELFKDFPVRVAGKTGTAQEKSNRPEHSSFAAFAPYEKPEIAVYVLMPFGTTKTMTAPAGQVVKKVIAEYMGLNVTPQHYEEVNSLIE